MTVDLAPASLAALPRIQAGRPLGAPGTAVSALLHVLLLAALLNPMLDLRRLQRAAAVPQITEVSFVNARPSPPASPPQAPPLRPALEPKPTAPAKPVTAPSTSASTASTASSSARSTVPSPHPPNDSADTEDVIGRIRDNWLMPPGTNDRFRCRLRIDYAIGGRITALHFLQGCGTPALDDSVKRAIWKTQTLPLPSAQREAGHLDLDFTP